MKTFKEFVLENYLVESKEISKEEFNHLKDRHDIASDNPKLGFANKKTKVIKNINDRMVTVGHKIYSHPNHKLPIIYHDLEKGKYFKHDSALFKG